MLYYKSMINNTEKLGVFIVPTGIGASIGGYAGDASSIAREFSKYSKLIVNPNVVNAGGFSGINDNMFYVEGFMLDEFMKGNINIVPSSNNKIGVIFDRAIPQDVLNVHINTINAVKTVYGIDIPYYEITEEPAGVDFQMDNSGISNGSINNPETLLKTAKNLIKKGCDAIAVVCIFEDPEELNTEYSQGIGVDPVGGVEAIISHYISKELHIPCAHSPAFGDYQISSEIVNPKSASEYITPTFLPCILLGLANAPHFSQTEGINVNSVDFVVMPYNSLGNPAVFAAVERGIKIYAVKENSTVLNVTADILGIEDKVRVVKSYRDCMDLEFA